MKRILVVLVCMVVAIVSAAEKFDWKKLGDLYRAKKYAELESTAKSMKASVTKDMEKGACVEYIVLAKYRQNKYSNSDAMITDVAALSAEFGISVNNDQVQSSELLVLQLMNENQKAIDISKTWTGKKTAFRRANCFTLLKRYADAAESYAKMDNAEGYSLAAKMAILAKLPEKVYEYSYNAFASGKVNNPVLAITLINYVIEADYTGTKINAAKVKELLQLVNRKYSRKLIVNNPTKWDELIQLVRQTLETY